MNSEVKEKIESLIQSKPVVLFMKGDIQFPQCGFSACAVQILKTAGLDLENLEGYDVLSDPEVRDGIKEFSNWPTIPQCYINGEFVGGWDILMEMYESGDLQTKLSTIK